MIVLSCKKRFSLILSDNHKKKLCKKRIRRLRMKNYFVFLIAAIISIDILSFSLVSCSKKEDQSKDINISIEDPENILSNKNEIIGEELIEDKYKIKIVEPNEKIDFKILIIKPEKDTDPNMIIVDPNKSTTEENGKIDNTVPEDVSTQIKDFINKIEKNKN